MTETDPFDSEEGTDIWRLSGRDPFSSVAIACEKVLPEAKNINVNFFIPSNEAGYLLK